MIFVERQLALEATLREDGLREFAKPKGTKATMSLKTRYGVGGPAFERRLDHRHNTRPIVVAAPDGPPFQGQDSLALGGDGRVRSYPVNSTEQSRQVVENKESGQRKRWGGNLTMAKRHVECCWEAIYSSA